MYNMMGQGGGGVGGKQWIHLLVLCLRQTRLLFENASLYRQQQIPRGWRAAMGGGKEAG